MVVSVARKTDGRHWADLFSAAGRSTEFCVSFIFCYFVHFHLNDLTSYLKCSRFIEKLSTLQFGSLPDLLQIVQVDLVGSCLIIP